MDVADGGARRDRREPLGAVVVGLHPSAAMGAAVEVLVDPPVDPGDAVTDHIGHHRCDRDGACHADPALFRVNRDHHIRIVPETGLVAHGNPPIFIDSSL
jgi:hypothetical protein